MAQIILGPHNGVRINGTRPRRPKTRRIKPPNDSQEQSFSPEQAIQSSSSSSESSVVVSPSSPSPPLPEWTQDVQLLQPSSPYLPQILNLINTNQWHVEIQPDNTISINLDSVHDLRDFLQTLGELAFQSTLDSSPDLSNHDNTSRGSAIVRRRRVLHPYIKYHSELYAETIWPSITCSSSSGTNSDNGMDEDQQQQQQQQQQNNIRIEWPTFYSTLSTIIDDCIHYFVECMNHYYPVRPRRVIHAWYNNLENPQEDVFALAIGTFWCRHLLIHHRPASITQEQDSKILDMIQHRLAHMTRDALGDYFDEPNIDRIFALCLCNMTTVFSMEQKATFHTLAVRMATALDIRPRTRDDDDDGGVGDTIELENRLWWYLFQIDHFLHESGAIAKSMLSPNSDDLDALSRLVRPTPCSLDEPDEVAGALEWGHVLELWIIRRRIVREIETTLDRGELLTEHMYDNVKATLYDWKARIPELIKSADGTSPSTLSCHGNNNNNNSGSLSMAALEESRLAASMEFCTNTCLILHHFCPHQDAAIISPLERQAILDMIEYSTEMLRLRRAVLSFAPCQTWPGDLKRSIEILMYCTEYGDDLITGRAKHGLNHARHVLRKMAEVKWKDPICMVLINDIEHVLYASPSHVSNNNVMHEQQQQQQQQQQQPQQPPRTTQRAAEEDESIRRRSIKMANNMYTGVMMFDRELQPRAQYYRPANTSDPLDSVTVFEDVSRYMN
ncbi:predicted protein [Lichtheimia corymbifera JMRC:FSU:9682]|uniref:Transcription factor domain-containing protein n=1 Tax=Lichtheimia corymbifera JMRC:FSU:9682 TaxID=1263082 RepID=A0A068RKB2_9FUNG|nr:predicted protein [Lichtheimia corymbifera JMRC:FSU:9682]